MILADEGEFRQTRDAVSVSRLESAAENPLPPTPAKSSLEINGEIQQLPLGRIQACGVKESPIVRTSIGHLGQKPLSES
jgi:hypothetical protein